MNYSDPKIASQPGAGESRPTPPRIKLPRVTVVVTCFNYARFVGHALDSVAAQSYRDFDCAVIDDASTDDSADLIEQWIAMRKDARFRLIRSETNKGQMASFAAGLAASSGEFVAFLDADDFWFPEFLQRHVEVHLNGIWSASVSCSDLVQIDDEGRILAGTYVGPIFDGKASRDGYLYLHDGDLPRIDPSNAHLEFLETSAAKYVRRGYLEHPWTVTSGMMFRRTTLDLVMPCDPESVPICADGYVFVMCHFFTGSLAIKRALAAYRRHGRNQFAFLPVLGGSEISPAQSVRRHREVIIRAMLRHLLERCDELGVVFTPARVRSLIRRLFRHLLRLGIHLELPRLRAVLGDGRVFRDRMRAKVGFLRRRLR